MKTPLWCDKSFCQNPELEKNPFPIDSSKDFWLSETSGVQPPLYIIIYPNSGVVIIPPVMTQGQWGKKLKLKAVQRIW